MTVKISAHLIVCIALLVFQGNLKAQTIVERGTSKLYRLDPSGKLVYSKDTKGNRLPDFSHVGYHSGERAIPHVPVKITLEPSQGDDTRRIQDALDKLGALPLGQSGHRGALLLKRGVYRVDGTLMINHSGTVLRGQGNGPDGSVVIATGYDDYKYKRALIKVGPKSDGLQPHTSHRYFTGNYFGWSLVSASGKRATVQDCANLGHASKIAGGRRYTFMIDGQLNLVQRCLAYNGRHEFVTQARTAGPNVFVDCIGFDSKSSAGPHHRYSVGTLFDNVKSERPMESRFRGNSGTGHDWAGTQTCFYNCVAPGFEVKAPPGGISWVIGSGKNDEEGARVTPASLYYQQVQDRLGKGALDRLATAEQRKDLGKYLWVKERLKKSLWGQSAIRH